MDNINMNQQLGTKWFTFYTKVRPFLACLLVITTIVDFIQYPDVYFDYWWLLLSLVAAIVQPILCIIVAVKSNENYIDFVRFVKGVLLFEIINISFQQGVKQYITSQFEIIPALVIFSIGLSVGYFTWYRLNVKYFEKRILVTPNFDNGETNNYQQSTSANNAVVEAPEIPQNNFCRNCGNKLIDGSRFCSKCGTKIDE